MKILALASVLAALLTIGLAWQDFEARKWVMLETEGERQ